MWWQDGVIYQIYPRSFADADGDGVGDLRGLHQHLDHLAWLGVDALWLSPIYRSPMRDFGYDVSDHCDVDPIFGTLADADDLVAAAHDLGIRVVLDYVPNHTSIDHPWFTEHPDFYLWRDGGGPGGEAPPNNWTRAFPFPPAAPAWTRDPATGRWYLHLFLPEQPDLDWSNPAAEAAMHDVLRFWLDRGVDGFRMDVVHCIGKDPALPDDPPSLTGVPHTAIHEDPRTHELIRRLRAVIDGYDDRMAVGEVFLIGEKVTERTAAYAGPDQLHLAFDFAPLRLPWGDAGRWRARLERVEAVFGDADGRWPTWAFGNHDNPRLRTRWGGTEAVARAAALLQLGLRGTPFLYAGDELGLLDAEVPEDRRVDPGGRDGCRAPIPWTAEPGHAWGPEPWLPFAPEARARAVAALRADETSILWLHKRLLASRKASPALRRGAQHLLDAGDDVVAFERHDPASGDRRVVLVSMAPEEVAVPLEGEWLVERRSDGPDGEGDVFHGRLGAGVACWLRPG
jgi:alpha-glucosidase